ncbi:c-type cytochrome [Nitrospira lenta]|uniref:Cytochrome c domain-containing protein n=1 Tax=Nitrospira lenta TaxID=1436998 RepID=A0A330L1D4_9BACT|nr:cytochrome c [Nitrospira lenta]SPP63069.1 exported hypothetical protein [Nitrospira lenta]
MHKTSRTLAFTAAAILLIRTLAVADQDVPADLPSGKALYQHHCATCHGQTGWGDGPNATLLRVAPANFHQFRSFLKSDEELLRMIEHGIVFSPMHAWTGNLTERQMIDVLAYLRLLSQQEQ